MKIEYGKGKTKYGPGVNIELTGDEVATAIDAWLVGQGFNISGARTVTVNGNLCEYGRVYVDPSGFVITPEGNKLDGRGKGDLEIKDGSFIIKDEMSMFNNPEELAEFLTQRVIPKK